MGPVSVSLLAASVLVVLLTRKASDRSFPVLAWCLLISLALSLGVHVRYDPVGRATPLMLIDAAGLYVTGMMAICRFDTPRWLYAICLCFLLQCAAHLAYVSFLISNNVHILVLNTLYVTELAALLAGARRRLVGPSTRRRMGRAFA